MYVPHPAGHTPSRAALSLSYVRTQTGHVLTTYSYYTSSGEVWTNIYTMAQTDLEILNLIVSSFLVLIVRPEAE